MTHPRVAKPDEFVRLHGVTEDLFELLREAFDVPIVMEVVLDDVDRATHAPHDERAVAASAMYATQLLRRATTRGIPVTNAEVVLIAGVLDAAIERLVHTVAAGDQGPLLQARDRINEGARCVAALSVHHENVVVELR